MHRPILQRHVRRDGDDSNCVCKICLASLQRGDGSCLHVLQCPECDDPVHTACLLKWVRTSPAPVCPNCKVPILGPSGMDGLHDTWECRFNFDPPREYRRAEPHGARVLRSRKRHYELRAGTKAA